MPLHTCQYRNKAGLSFEIEVDRKNAPEGANFWLYLFSVKEPANNTNRNFRALVLKEIAATQSLADAVVITDPLKFLQNNFLDRYDKGETPVYWPDLTPGWIVQ